MIFKNFFKDLPTNQTFTKEDYLKFNHAEDIFYNKYETIKGYKITNFDGKCRDFQYEVGKTYSLPENKEPDICKQGFHFCTNITDLTRYYNVGRVFEVTALVPYEQVKRKSAIIKENFSCSFMDYHEDSKFSAKTITINRELTYEELREKLFIADYYYLLKTKEDYNDMVQYILKNNISCDQRDGYKEWGYNLMENKLLNLDFNKDFISVYILNPAKATFVPFEKLEKDIEKLEILLNTMENRDIAISTWLLLNK